MAGIHVLGQQTGLAQTQFATQALGNNAGLGQIEQALTHSLIQGFPSLDQAAFGLFPGGPTGGFPIGTGNAGISSISLALMSIFTFMFQLLLSPKASPKPIDLNNHAETSQNLEKLVSHDPVVSNLVANLVNVEPESPQASQQTQQLVETMQQSGYSAGDIEKTNILIAALQLNKIQATLQAIRVNLLPGSSEDQQIQERLSVVQQINATLSQQLSQLS